MAALEFITYAILAVLAADFLARVLTGYGYPKSRRNKRKTDK